MREYGYAIIGWVGDAAGFYEKTVGATFIEGDEPKNSVYSEMVSMSFGSLNRRERSLRLFVNKYFIDISAYMR